MAGTVYWGWGLLAPAIFSIAYGFMAHYALEALGFTQKNTVWERIRMSLIYTPLFVSWGIVNIPLPLLYLMAFLVNLLLLFHKGGNHSRKLFLLNLTHLMDMAFHMILIGTIALVTSTHMNEMLQNPFWRITTISIVLAANNLAACLVPRWNLLLGILRTQLDSEEVRPFMVFLWFSNIFLLLDSVLCISTIKWNLLPLFLIGSTLLMEFYLIRFLSHLFRILTAQYLEKEYQRLTKELSRQDEADKELRSKSDRDSLTGVFSRRFVIEQAKRFLREKRSFSLVYIDLDQLKQINDRHGHHAGDLYLMSFAKLVGSTLRAPDVFGRIGGDEFIILLPDYHREQALECMTHIRSQLCEEFHPPISFSFGVTFVPEGYSGTLEQILHTADQEMYRDKRNRRRGGNSC